MPGGRQRPSDAPEATLTGPNPDGKTTGTDSGSRVQHPKWRPPRPQHGGRGAEGSAGAEPATLSFPGIGCAPAAPSPPGHTPRGRGACLARRPLEPARPAGDYFARRMCTRGGAATALSLSHLPAARPGFAGQGACESEATPSTLLGIFPVVEKPAPGRPRKHSESLPEIFFSLLCSNSTRTGCFTPVNLSFLPRGGGVGNG